MADTSVIKKDVTFKFSNDTTRKVSVNNFNPSTEGEENAVNDFRAKIQAFNDSDVTLAATAYFSNADDNGNVFPVTSITDANVTITEKTVIYATSESARLSALNISEGGE